MAKITSAPTCVSRVGGDLGLAEAYCLASGLALQILCARFLGPADYGRYAVLRTIELWGCVILVGGVPQALRSAVAVGPGNLPAAIRWVIGLQVPICLATSLLLAGFAESVGRLLGDTDIAGPLRVSAIGLAIQAGLLEPWLNIINGLGLFRLQLRILLIFGTSRLLITAFAAGMTGNLTATLAASAASCLVSSVVAAWAVLRLRDGQKCETGRPMVCEIRAWVGYAPAYEAIALGLFASNLWLVKSQIADLAAVSRYSACYLVAQASLAAARAGAGSVFSPLAAAAARRDATAASEVVESSSRELILVLAPAVAATAILGDKGIAILFGSVYAHTGPLAGILMFAASVYSMTVLLGGVLGAIGRQRERLLAVLPGAFLGVPATIALLRWQGLEGAAWGLLVTATLALIPLACLVRRHLGQAISLVAATQATIAAAVMAATSACLRSLSGPLAAPSISLVLGLIVYCGCLEAMGVPIARFARHRLIGVFGDHRR